MDATVIGRVAVKVVPETSDFRRDTQRELNAAEQGLRVEVDVEALTAEAIREVRRATNVGQQIADANEINLHINLDATTEIQAGIRQIDRELDRLRDRTDLTIDLTTPDLEAARELLEEELQNIAIGVELQEDERRRVQHELDSFDVTIPAHINEATLRESQARLALLARTRIVDLAPRINEVALAKAEATLAALTGARALSNIGDDIANSLGNLDKNALKLSNISLAVVNLSGYLLTATSNAFTFGASLASIGGTALALPGILGGIGLGVGATIAVFKDFNKVLPDVGDRFGALQNSMSDSFWTKAQAPFREFIDTIFPQFAAGMEDTASALGDYFGNFATSAEGIFDGALTNMFDDLGESILIAGDHTDSLIGIISKLGSVGAGNLPALSEFFGGMLDDFDEWLTEKGPAGLQEYVDEGTQALQDLGGALNGVGRIFAAVARSAEKAGGSTLATVRDTLDGAADAVSGDAFQQSMTKTFRAAHEGMSSIADAAGDEFQSLMHRLADTLDAVLPSAGRTLGSILEGVFGALDQDVVQDSIVGAFDTLEVSLGRIVGTLDGVAVGAAGVVDVVAALVDSISRSLTPILDALGPKVGEVSDELVPLIGNFGDVAEIIANVLGAALDILPAKLIVIAGGLTAVVLLAPRIKAAIATMTGSVAAMGLAAKAAALPLIALPRNLNLVATTAMTAGARTQREAARMSTALAGVGRAMATFGPAAGAMALSLSGADEALGVTNTTMGVLIGSMLGPWGAAAGAVVGGLVDIRNNAKQADKQARAFRDTMADPDATFAQIEESLRKTAAAYDGYIDKFKDGGNGGLFENIARGADLLDGQDDQLIRLSSAAKDANSSYYQLGNTLGEISFKLGNLDAFQGPDENKSYGVPQLKELQDIATRLKPRMDELGISLDDVSKMDATEIETFKTKIIDLVKTADSEAGRMTGFGAAVKDLDDATLTASVSADALKKSLDALFDPTLNAEEAADAYRQALADMNDQLAGNKAGFQGYSENALGNRDATREAIGALKDYLVTQAGAGASAAQIAALVDNARQAFIDEGVAAGYSKTAIEARANAIGLTPDLITTVFKETGIDLTRGQIKRLVGDLGRLPTKVQTYIENNGVPQSIAEINRIDGKLGTLTRKQRQILIRLLGSEKVDEQIETTKTKAKALGDVDIISKVTVKDEATPVIDKASGKATNLNKQKTVVTVSIKDHASAPIARISQAVRSLDAQSATVNVSHITTYTVRYRGGTPGGRSEPDTLGGAAGRAVAKVQKSLARQFKANYDEAIQQFVVSAENKFDALLRKFKSKSQKTKLKGMFVDDLTALQKLQFQHARLMKQYDNAAQKLRSLREEMANYKTAIADTIKGTGDVTAMGASTYDGIVRGLEAARDKALRFTTAIKALIKSGLNKTTLQQILAAGPEAGLAAAESILSGGVKAINEIQGDIDKAAAQAASAGGNAIYGPLVANAQKDVNNLLKQLVPLQRKIADFVTRLMRALAAQLKAKAIQLKLGDIVQISSGNGGSKGSKPRGPAPKTASGGLSADVAAGSGVTVVSSRTLIYNAAENNSLDSEASLFDALSKPGSWI